MFKENWLDAMLRRIKRLVPDTVFRFFEPVYHTVLAYAGALWYGFPSRSLKVIGVTGTKGKSTTTYLVAKLLEGAGHPVAAIGSLGYKIKDKEWPNTLKMTMPGRFKIQKFLAEARKAGCTHAVLEVTSQGIQQKRHLGIHFDCAVFTNLHKEHIEAHGSFEHYLAAKQELFRRTANMHVINADDPYTERFGNFPARCKIFYGSMLGDMRAEKIVAGGETSSFEVYGTPFTLRFGGLFNVFNALAALSVGALYGADLPAMRPTLEGISRIPGRMEFIQKEPFGVVVDYAHTPDSLEAVYVALKPTEGSGRLICVLGACGGGRDRWKRPEFGRIAAEQCDHIILTNEDPYDENPEHILDDIEKGLERKAQAGNVVRVLDRRAAIREALTYAQKGDTVVITGKGSETSMALAHGKKIPWSDADVVRALLQEEISK